MECKILIKPFKDYRDWFFDLDSVLTISAKLNNGTEHIIDHLKYSSFWEEMCLDFEITCHELKEVFEFSMDSNIHNNVRNFRQIFKESPLVTTKPEQLLCFEVVHKKEEIEVGDLWYRLKLKRG